MLTLFGSASEYKVIGGDVSMARLLIERGAAVNARDDLGWSPLLFALDLWADQPALLDLLLENGADIHARVKDGRTGLMLAAHLGRSERLLLLLARGADVNAQDGRGMTALMTATLARDDQAAIKTIRILLDHGANVNARDANGDTALMLASRRAYQEMVSMLRRSGAKD
jgi:ankyrin repeat protein